MPSPRSTPCPQDGSRRWTCRWFLAKEPSAESGTEHVVVEREAATAPVRLDRACPPQRDVTVLVEVVAVGQLAGVLPEDLRVPLAHHLGEVAVVGLLGHLDATGVSASSLLQAPHDV